MLKSIITPCKDCEERYAGCHSKCELYIDWKKVHEAEKKRIDDERNKEIATYNDHRIRVRHFLRKGLGK